MSTRAETLKSYFQNHTDQALRPILTSLNGDGSWLISFPLPSPSLHRRFYHIVSDAWLNGPAVAGASWLVCIERPTSSAAKNGGDVDAMIREIELAGAAAGGTATVPGQDSGNEEGHQWLDAIFVNFHLLDHMHKPTLVTFDKKIPVFAPPDEARTIQNWGHFTTVVATQDFKPSGNEWRGCHPGSPLPSWLSVFRIPGNRALNFATAIVWSHNAATDANGTSKSPQKHEILLNAPHGINITSPAIQMFLNSTQAGGADEVEVLALLAALKDSFNLGMRETLGVSGSLALERLAKPRYWVRSHDTVVKYGGVLLRLMRAKDVPRTLDDGLHEEEAMGNGDGRRPNLVDVANGEFFALE